MIDCSSSHRGDRDFIDGLDEQGLIGYSRLVTVILENTACLSGMYISHVERIGGVDSTEDGCRQKSKFSSRIGTRCICQMGTQAVLCSS